MGTGTDDNTPDPAVDRVRRELARLGRDDASAPPVPPEVTARVGAALRSAGAPAHSVGRPPLRRVQVVGLIVGLAAVVTALIVGAWLLAREPASPFPPGPTAERITVSRPAPPVS